MNVADDGSRSPESVLSQIQKDIFENSWMSASAASRSEADIPLPAIQDRLYVRSPTFKAVVSPSSSSMLLDVAADQICDINACRVVDDHAELRATVDCEGGKLQFKQAKLGVTNPL